MIPIKDKKYGIACFGPYDYNQFGGTGFYTGRREGSGEDDDPFLYEFLIVENDLAWFTEKDIICEAV